MDDKDNYYYEAVKNDVLEWWKEAKYTCDPSDIYDEAFNEDSITGNMSGSYTCDAWQAEEYVCHNLDLAREALEEFGYDSLPVDKLDAEYLDVIIRIHVLGQVLGDIEDDMIAEQEALQSEENEDE